MMDKSRYQKKAQVAKSRQETEQKQCVEENAQKASVSVPESEPALKNEPAQKKLSKESMQLEGNGVFVSQDAAEKLRLTMLQQSEMMKQIAEMFGGKSSEENVPEPEAAPEVKSKVSPQSNTTSRLEPNEEPDAEPEYKPKHGMKPKTQANPELVQADKDEDEESESESGWKLDRVYEFCDSRTGELLYVRNDDFWTAYQFAGENYRRIWAWLCDGRFVREANPDEVSEVYPGLFLSKG